MLLSNHLKIELKFLTKNACLLGYNSNQFIPCLAFPKREGAYLYYDVNREVFVRSGKVVRRGFQARHDKHYAGSKEEKSSTHFYFMYPSYQGKRQAKRDKLGCFEHLTQVIAVGFDPAAEPAMHITKDCNKGGLLILSRDNERQIKSALKKDLTPVQKFQEVVEKTCLRTLST